MKNKSLWNHSYSPRPVWLITILLYLFIYLFAFCCFFCVCFLHKRGIFHVNLFSLNPIVSYLLPWKYIIYLSPRIRASFGNMSVKWTPLYTLLLYSKTRVYTDIHFFLIFALKHISWVRVRMASARQRVITIYVLSKNQKNIIIFYFFIWKLPFLQSWYIAIYCTDMFA